MWFKSNNKKRREEAAKCMASIGAAAGQGYQAGSLGFVRMVECTPEQDAFRKNVESEVERRLAHKKAFEAHEALPAYRITSSYNVDKNEDAYHLQVKQFNNSWGAAETYYSTIYTSTDKAGVDARFNRLMPKPAKGKKAA